MGTKFRACKRSHQEVTTTLTAALPRPCRVPATSLMPYWGSWLGLVRARGHATSSSWLQNGIYKWGCGRLPARLGRLIYYLGLGRRPEVHTHRWCCQKEPSFRENAGTFAPPCDTRRGTSTAGSAAAPMPSVQIRRVTQNTNSEIQLQVQGHNVLMMADRPLRSKVSYRHPLFERWPRGESNPGKRKKRGSMMT